MAMPTLILPSFRQLRKSVLNDTTMDSPTISKRLGSLPLKGYVPILSWLPRYRRGWLRADVLAGITVWGTTVPTAMGYAQVAGLPVQTGLYAAMVALVAYAIFGTSSPLKVETSPSMAIMSAALLAPIALGDYSYYIILSAALAVTVGVFLIAAGLARMGFLADFLAKPVVGGFLFGLALVIIVGQIPSLLGLEAGKSSGLQQLLELLKSLGNTDLLTLMISAAAFLLLLLFKRYLPRFPGAIIVMALSILAVLVLNLDELGVALVGSIPNGLPSLQIPIVRPVDLLPLMLGAVAMVFVALGESLGTARSFAAEHQNRIDTDQELVALGAANLGAGLFQGFAVGANPSTTASTNAARARSQIASLVTAGIIMLTISTRVDVISYLPQAVVAMAVIISASHLLDLKKLNRYYRMRKIDFVLAVVALVGVFVVGILPGLLTAVFLSLFIVLYQSSQPHLAVLGKLPGHDAFVDINENPDTEQIPGLLIVRPDAPLFFINANTLHSQIRRLVASASRTIEAVLIDLSASEDLDVASTDMLKNLKDDLGDGNVGLLLADVKTITRERLEHTGLMDQIEEGNVYLRVEEGVEVWTKRSRRMY